MMQSSRLFTRSGVTLLEMLAVIVLAAMITSAITVNMVAVDDSTSVREAASDWQELDRRARLLARTGQHVVMEILDGQSGEATTVIVRSPESNEIMYSRVLAQGVIAEVTPESSNSAVTFDLAGRSIDYELRLRREGSAEQVWQFHGLTGVVDSGDGAP